MSSVTYASELAALLGTNTYAAKLRIHDGSIGSFDLSGNTTTDAIKLLKNGTVEMPVGIYTNVIHAQEVRVTSITEFTGTSIVLSDTAPSFYGDSSSLMNEIATVGNVSAETTRAASSEGSLSLRVSTEEIRAASSEGSLSLRVSTEEIRAASSEGSLSLRVSTEEIRAASSEGSLSARV